MRIHFFSRADKPGRFAFHTHYVLQNLKTVRVISAIYFIFTLLIRLIFSIYNLPGRNIGHIDDFNTANWLALFASPVFYIASRLLLKAITRKPALLRFAQLLAYVFAMYIILSAMRATFFTMYNPRNSLVMYLLGLILVSVFFTLEYYETLIITVLTGISFALLLPFYQHTINELILNNLASLILLICFFSISRYLFSYRADNFYKLRAIEDKNLEIETASLLKNEMLGVVAHDLRNPLSVIRSATSLVEMEEVNEEVFNYIRMINASCEKAGMIINDLIETAQNDYHHEFELTNTHINQFLALIIDEWAKNKKEQVSIRYCDAAHAIYTCIQPEKMQRVMDNLISNALKFSGEGDYIQIKLSDSPDEVFITVEDFGIGIPQEHLPQIFERFSKARRNGLRGEESIGLGLNIVHQIVKKHHGYIGVESMEQKGTIFTITLPKRTV